MLCILNLPYIHLKQNGPVLFIICGVIKQNQSEVGQIQFSLF